MKQYIYKDRLYNLKELSELTGVKYTTLSERFKRGYSVEEAVKDSSRIPESIAAFDEASNYKDWHGSTGERIYSIYFKWCISNGYSPESKVHFTRCIKHIHSNIRIVPTRLKIMGEVCYKRVIRVDPT